MARTYTPKTGGYIWRDTILRVIARHQRGIERLRHLHRQASRAENKDLIAEQIADHANSMSDLYVLLGSRDSDVMEQIEDILEESER